MAKTKVVYGLIALLVVSLIVGIVGCTPATTTTTPATTTTTTAAAPKTLKIGATGALTGAAAAWGEAMVNGSQIIADQINAKGGLKVGNDSYMIEVIPADHKAQGTEAVAAVNKLIFQDGVKFISNSMSSPSLAMIPITEANKVLLVTAAYAAVIGPDKPMTFRLHYTAYEVGEGLYGYVKSNMPNVKSVAFLGNDDDTGKAGTAQSKKIAGEMGMTLLSTQLVPRGTTDFYPTLTKILPENPDMIDVDTMAPADVALFIKQSRERGFQGPILATAQNDPDLIIKVAGKESAEGYLQEGPDFNGSVATPEMKAFYNDYIKKYGEPFNPTAGLYAQGIIIITQGIMKAQSIDPVKVAEVLPDSTINVFGNEIGFGGLERYGAKHQLAQPIYASMMKDGRMTTVGKYIPKVP